MALPVFCKRMQKENSMDKFGKIVFDLLMMFTLMSLMILSASFIAADFLAVSIHVTMPWAILVVLAHIATVKITREQLEADHDPWQIKVQRVVVRFGAVWFVYPVGHVALWVAGGW